MKKLFILSFSFLFLLCLFSCLNVEYNYDPYDDWQNKNSQWFSTVADSARTAINEAKKQWGDDWENHCEWRMYKRWDQSQEYNTGRTDDSICVRINHRGIGSESPTWSDTIRFSYRGWLMPTTYEVYNADNELVDSVMQEVFDQTYYGVFDQATAAPVLSGVSASFVVGFSTALQYMVEGDDWDVYIPERLAYGENKRDAVPAYSTLLFRINLAAVYPCNTGVPVWKARRR